MKIIFGVCGLIGCAALAIGVLGEIESFLKFSKVMLCLLTVGLFGLKGVSSRMQFLMLLPISITAGSLLSIRLTKSTSIIQWSTFAAYVFTAVLIFAAVQRLESADRVLEDKEILNP